MSDSMDIRKKEELKTGYIKVTLDYAPKTNGKKMREWCEKHGFAFLGSGRRAWCSSLGTYLRDASGIAYADGEPFIFYEEDLVDLEAHTTNRIRQELENTLEQLPDDMRPPDGSTPFSMGYNKANRKAKAVITNKIKEHENGS